MDPIALYESGGLRAAEGGKWAATLITAGRGSSGTYSETMLAEHGPKAFPAGTKLFFKHPGEGQGPGDRDPRDQFGFLESDASYESGIGLTGKVKVLPHWKDVVDSIGTQASLSIYAMGESDKQGNVTALLPGVGNSIDMVSYPGRAGSGLTQKLEAARAASHTRTVTAADEKADNMDEKAVEALVERLLDAKLAPVVSYINEQSKAEKASAQAKVDAAAINGAVEEALVSFDAKVVAIEAADIFDVQKERLKARARKGKDVADAITEAVAETKAIREQANVKVVTEAGAGFAIYTTDTKPRDGQDIIASIGSW